MQRADNPAAYPLWAGGALVVAVAAAYGLVSNPELLHVEFSPRSVAALVLALAGAALLIRYPGAAVVVLVGLVYLNVSELLVRFHGLPSVIQAVALPLVAAAWIGQGTDRARQAFAPTPLVLALVAYLLALMVSTTWARTPDLADERLVEHAKALIVFFLIVLLVWSPAQARRATWTVMAAGALLGAIVLFQSATGSYESTFGGLGRVKYAQIYGDVFRPRVAGPLGDPNFFAQIMVPVVAIALVVAGRATVLRQRVMGLACAALATAGILLSYSRGALLALFVVFLLAAVALRISLRRVALAAVLLLALLSAFNPAGAVRRLATIRELLPGGSEVLDRDSSFAERSLLMRTAWLMFLDRPLLGVGAGNYTAYFDDYADRAGSAFRQYEGIGDRRYPHNLYLEVASETGLVGLALFAAALAACYAALHRAGQRYERAGDASLVAITRGLQVALAGYLVTALFLHGQFPRHLWLLLGLALAVERCSRDVLREQPARVEPAA